MEGRKTGERIGQTLNQIDKAVKLGAQVLSDHPGAHAETLTCLPMWEYEYMR